MVDITVPAAVFMDHTAARTMVPAITLPLGPLRAAGRFQHLTEERLPAKHTTLIPVPMEPRVSPRMPMEAMAARSIPRTARPHTLSTRQQLMGPWDRCR